MPAIIAIPVRLDSSRVPRKVLRNYKFRTILDWTLESASRAVRDEGEILIPKGGGKIAADGVFLFSDSKEVIDYAEALYFPTVFTILDQSRQYKNGTERIAHGIIDWANSNNTDLDDTIIINLQCDMVELDPGLLTDFINYCEKTYRSARENGYFLATVIDRDISKYDLGDQNIVKHIGTHCIPSASFHREIPNELMAVHVGIYAFDINSLRWYINARQTQNEIGQKLEQLRFTDNGMHFFTHTIDKSRFRAPISIDSNSFKFDES